MFLLAVEVEQSTHSSRIVVPGPRSQNVTEMELLKTCCSVEDFETSSHVSVNNQVLLILFGIVYGQMFRPLAIA